MIAVFLATSVHAAQLEVTWTDNSTGETGFKVERSWNGGAFTQIGMVGANVTTYSDSTVAPGTYAYRVRAYSGSTDSDYSNVTATTNVDPQGVSPAITTQPVDLTTTVGANVSLTVAASGTPAPTLQWMRNGSVITGATANTLSFVNVTLGDAATYTVVASNSAGTTQSSAATLRVSASTSGSTNSAPTFTTSPTAQSVAIGGSVSLVVAVAGTPAPTLQWQKDGVALAGATSATLALTSVTAAQAGVYRVIATNSVGSVTSATATLTVTASSAGTVPAFTTQPASQTVVIGAPFSLVALATGSPAPTYQWKKDGVAIAGALSPILSLTAAVSSEGSYNVVATNSNGTTSSATALVHVVAAVSSSPTPSRLVNASIRASAGQGAQTLIVGFVTTGSDKSVLMRGVGPGLAAYTTSQTYGDPALTLYQGAQIVTTNDNWGGATALQNVFTQLGAFSLAPASKDAALLTTLKPAAYTAQVTGPGSGMALVELYDADATGSNGRIVNIAARAQVSEGDNVVIAGFVIQGNTPRQVLIRGVGPGLTALGVSGTLSTPYLQLYQGSTLLKENSSWGGTPELSAAFSQAGAFPLADKSSRDTALLVTLAPGAYTAILSGANHAAGVALVEVYDLP